MILMVAVDDRGGMLFNKRRQSRDRALRERILAMTKDSRLWMNRYSYEQFDGMDGLGHVHTDENFLRKAAPGEYCFAEDVSAAPYIDRIEKIICFQWNRRYPADAFLDIDLSPPDWKRTEEAAFPGFSHEKITMEAYDRAKK